MISDARTHDLEFGLFRLFHIFDAYIRTRDALWRTKLWFVINICSSLCNWQTPNDFGWSYLSHRWLWPIIVHMLITVLSLQSEKSFRARKSLVQNSHQRVKHFGTDVRVHVLILLKIHLLRGATRYVVFENHISKQSDVFLVANTIAVVNILAILILVKALTMFWSI